MNSPAPKCKGCFSNSTPIYCVNIWSNILIPHTTWRSLRKLLTITHKDKSFHNSIEWSGLYHPVNITPWLGKSFRFTVFFQITGKWILWNSSPFGMIWSLFPDVEQLPNKIFLHEILFLETAPLSSHLLHIL